MTDWGARAGTLEGALANIINECELPSAQRMPLMALASIAAYARDVLARTAGRVHPAPSRIVPTGTGWPVT